VERTSNTTCFVKGVIINRTTTCFGYYASPSSGCYITYLSDAYMCKTIGCDILVISRESVVGNAVGMIRIISKFYDYAYRNLLFTCIHYIH
jgi:hypothetical protein